MVVLVTVLLLCVRRHMTEATYKKRAFNWGLLTVSEGESMTIMVGNVVTGRQAGMALEQLLRSYILT